VLNVPGNMKNVEFHSSYCLSCKMSKAKNESILKC
jgi:hypothetical protein